MKYRLRFSRTLNRDIESVLARTEEQFGALKMEQYKTLIRQAIERIAADPLGFPAKARPEIHPTIHTFHLARRGHPARHLILYGIGEDNVIRLYGLLHDSMDLRRHLPDDLQATSPESD